MIAAISQLKIAPTVASVVDNVTIQVLGPACVAGAVLKQLEDQPPKETPFSAGAVKVTVVPKG
jgi:hypothetical protein